MFNHDNRPTVFISSTISDFADLRSALGYYLEKSGYRVYMSETTTFPVNPNKSNFEQCFELIDKSQYYILLIGNKRGSWYKDGISTITQEEFRYARNKFEQTGDISLLTFIRSDVWSIINEYKRSQGINKSGTMEDIEFTTTFIDEITKDEDYIKAQKQDQSYPKGTWVSRFSRFSDIIDVMSMTMNIETNRRMEILRTLALEELQENIRACFDDYTTTGNAFPYALSPLLRAFSEVKHPIGQRFPAKEVRRFATIGVHGLNTKAFKSEAIKELISSGELLDYDIKTKSYKKSPIMKLAEVMIMEIDRIQSFFRSEEGYYSKLLAFSKDAEALPNEQLIEIPWDLFMVMWMQERTRIVFNNAWLLHQYLSHPEKDFSNILANVDPEYYQISTVSGQPVGSVTWEKVQTWFNGQNVTI
ncbi:hypothetical protein BAQ53_24430 [Bacillus sp. B25(2016b)]|uniref:DUF4062 domain-containing protein n=1 Tax=Bacillus sp. B25(2016b) TaxID=1868655 RepID=UPI000803F38D|nr:DUF4062 domain-containing protein [Bacillus sp. B25(2016b)]ANP83876.1 hypothetical protein BAQ53_24430 [Bacillus sp. B25(2016b)]